jgi:uncharacterized phage-like protein YoqJ
MNVLRITITGHRPKDLVDADRRPLPLAAAIESFFIRASARAKATGHDAVEVVTGGALGVDQALAEAVASHRAVDGIAFRSVIVLPFPPKVLGASWRPEEVAHLERLVAAADEVRGPLAETYQTWVLHARNKAMVDISAMVVAFWSGKRSGGTYACLTYALTRAKPPRPCFNAFAGFAPIARADMGLPVARTPKET